MDAETIVVKIEPLDSEEETENGDQSKPPGDRDGPEFVCIKVEQDLDASYKDDPSGDVSPDTTNDCFDTPLTSTDCEIPLCVEINIKGENSDQCRAKKKNNIIEGKKKRGSNYTEAEKETLLKICKKYHHVIENKETNAHMIAKKRETWDIISHEYNDIAVSGVRTWQQVRHLYENIKQRSKKVPRKGTKDATDSSGYKSSTESDGQISAQTPEQPSDLYEEAAIRIGSLEGGYFCQICLKKFANPGNVQRHMLIHTKEKHTCPDCTKQFYSIEQLQKHMSRHTPAIRSHICEYCQKAFKSTSNLMQHKKVHLEVKPYFCTQCHRSFAFKANLTKHQGKSRCKRPIDEPIQCHVCNKIFDKEFLLKSHLRRHDPCKPFSCDQCTMSFKYKSTLIRHVQLHNGVRPVVCPVCDKAFTHLALLKPHMRVHTGEKPYTCPVCTKDFAHKHNMQRHALRHEKKKHLVCDVCHKKFPKESRLIYHMKTHVNEKYFACSICPKRFSHRQNIIRHYERKHPHAKYEGKETDASVALKVWDTFKTKYNEEPEEILG